jgi:hypothetical protein
MFTIAEAHVGTTTPTSLPHGHHAQPSKYCKMAGNVRQPIDIASLERYITANVPEIKVPVDVKQVRSEMVGRWGGLG